MDYSVMKWIEDGYECCYNMLHNIEFIYDIDDFEIYRDYICDLWDEYFL